MKTKVKIFNRASNRYKDDNGFLHLKKSPILKVGTLEYLGKELIDGGDDNIIDGVKIKPDKVYKVYISPEELKKGANSFKLAPVQFNHTWLGKEGKDAKKYQQGSLGETWTIENGHLMFPMNFTGGEVVDAIENHECEELSASYKNGLVKSKRAGVDFDAVDIEGNHVALVDKGRCGHSVKVLNSGANMNKIRVSNELKLVADGKVIDLTKFVLGDQEDKQEVENSESMKKARDILEIANGEDGDDNKLSRIAELLDAKENKAENEDIEDEELDEEAEMENDDDELDEIDDEEEMENEDIEDEELDEEEVENDDDEIEDIEEDEEVEAENDDIEDEELDEDEEDVEAENEDIEEDEEEEKVKIAKNKCNNKATRRLARVKAYNSVSRYIGPFKTKGLSTSDIYAKGLAEYGLNGKGSEAELRGAWKAISRTKKVDNKYKSSNADYNGGTTKVFDF